MSSHDSSKIKVAANPSLQLGFQGSTEPYTSALESPATLLIKHLPDAIPQNTLSRLLFWWKALHLMNKMNIPQSTPPLPPGVPAPLVPPPHSLTVKLQSADMSSDESKMESSDE
ncbi:uncharacterized protein LOC131609912 isoform X2 [Vicia villosa]|nr:uncharacterized protein LOC131609912 isoform X2 [Vicia villosa]